MTDTGLGARDAPWPQPEVKLFEIRDEGTLIPTICIRIDAHDPDMSESDRWLMRWAGYNAPLILMGHLQGGTFRYDPYDWGDRTRKTAHLYIKENWDKLTTGDVIDVQHLLGETPKPKIHQRLEMPEHPLW